MKRSLALYSGKLFDSSWGRHARSSAPQSGAPQP